MSYLPNSTFRSCDRPGCQARYEAETGPLGQTPERSWRLHKTFGLHLCPDHSGLWGAGEGPHVPRLDYLTRAASCSCGVGIAGATLGQMAGAYLAHLGELPKGAL